MLLPATVAFRNSEDGDMNKRTLMATELRRAVSQATGLFEPLQMTVDQTGWLRDYLVGTALLVECLDVATIRDRGEVMDKILRASSA